MTINDLKSILYSTTGSIQFAILWDSKTNNDLENGCSIDYVVKNYADYEIKHIEAFENQLLLTI